MFADKVSKTSIGMYKNLNKTGKPTNNEWTVLTTILTEINNKLEVVALGTGTKCLGKLQMQAGGIILNDSHAEVICRRSFIRYLYNEMLADTSDILYKAENAKFFKLCKGIKFHMYSTLMPCGDASIFPKSNETHIESDEILESKSNNLNLPTTCLDTTALLLSDDEDLPTSKRIKYDVHRTGAKCLPDDSKTDSKSYGAGYHVLGAIRTKPGRGDPTLSVSCSDKLSKWIQMGIQGSLISILLEEPIYLSSITIGNSYYSKEALERALYKRFIDNSKLSDLKYKVQIPEIFNSVLYEFTAQKCDHKQPCPSSIIFTKNRKVEVAVEGFKQGTTKKSRFLPKGRLSICKLELFKAFIQVAGKIKFDVDKEYTYRTLKLSTQYAKCWTIVKNVKFIVWPVKEASLQDFLVDI